MNYKKQDSNLFHGYSVKDYLYVYMILIKKSCQTSAKILRRLLMTEFI